MSDRPPPLPNYDRSVELPVAILRTIIVVVFVGAWYLILRSDFFKRPTYLSISPPTIDWGAILLCSPVILFTGFVALAFWEEAYTWVRKAYDDDVAAYHAYHAKIRQEREAAEYALLRQRVIENEIKAEIAKINQQINEATKRRQELSR